MKSGSFLISALLFITSFSLHGQNPLSDSSSITLKEVTISVNKTTETKKTVAQMVNVITAKEIENAQAQSTADLIANTGMATIQKSQQGGGSPVLRGFEASRVLLVVDGVRMNNLIYRTGHLQNILTMDNAILDRVEVLFGPSSTVYGSDALGGVIHMYTRKPVFAEEDERRVLRVNASTRYGSVNDEFTGHFDFNVGGHKFSSLTSFTYSDFGDLKGGENQNPFYTGTYGERPYYAKRINGIDSIVKNDDRYLQVQSGYSQYDLLQKFLLKSGKSTHGLNIQYSSSTDIPRYDRLTDPGSAGLSYAEWYYGPQERLMLGYQFSRFMENGFFQNLNAGVNFQGIEESRHQRRFNSANLDHRTENVNVIGANVNLQRITAKHNLRLGLDFQYNTLMSTAERENIESGATEPLDTRYPDGDNTMYNASVYYSHTWMLDEQNTITDGIRVGTSGLKSTFTDGSSFQLPYSEAEQTNFVYSGSLAFIHSPTDDLKLSLFVATGFRVPNVDDLAKIFESAPGTLIVPNPDLKPEKTINYELGMTNIINEKSRWENAVYYTRFYDAIVADRFTFNGQDSVLYDGTRSAVYANQNKREAYLYGFSSNFKSQCTEHLMMTMTAGYTYGRIKTDTNNYPLDHVPPFMARLGVSYSTSKFSSDFYVNYNGWKRLKDYNLGGEDNEQYATPEGMPAWFTVNLHLSYKVWKYLTLQSGVDNIFDSQYRTFSSGINAPGRNVFAALRFHY